LKVISRTSTQKYKSAPENLREIAKQLGVSNILEGSVQKVADQVRVSVQLINATNDAHLWAEIYDRKLTDIFKVESDIAKTIADTLRAKLTGSEEHAISLKPTADPAAYQLYLKGRFFWGRRSGDNIPKAIGYFKEAIAISSCPLTRLPTREMLTQKPKRLRSKLWKLMIRWLRPTTPSLRFCFSIWILQGLSKSSSARSL
ncbi:MAG: hypothetical protein DME50_08660, partial [Verrucomicrobia bacterium]